VIDSDGKLIKNDISDINEKYNQEYSNIFISLIDVSKINRFNMTYYNIKKFLNKIYNVRKVANDSVNFFLVLSPSGNFYINDKLKSVESQISDKFTDTIVLNGYLKFNEVDYKNEFNIIDLIYYNELLLNNTFQERYNILLDLQNLIFTSIVDEILVYPDVYSDIIEGSYEIIENNKLSKLIFVDTGCCDYIIWGNGDAFPDIIQLQIVGKSKQSITFGYDNNIIPEGIGLDFLTNYTFNKRDIPIDLFVNDYFNIKINRDANGNVVPNRKISIIEKSTKVKTFDETVDILLTKFNPIENIFFNDPERWDIQDKTYTFASGKLSVA